MVSSIVFSVLFTALTSNVYSTIMTEIKGEYVMGLNVPTREWSVVLCSHENATAKEKHRKRTSMGLPDGKLALWV